MALIRMADLLASPLPDSPLPDSPLDAAARFYAEAVPRITSGAAAQGGDEAVTLLFAPADHSHRGWREAAVASLARMLAPRRVNAMVGDEAGSDPAAIAATQAFLESSGAMTGQLLPLDSHGAGGVLGCVA